MRQLRAERERGKRVSARVREGKIKRSEARPAHILHESTVIHHDMRKVDELALLEHGNRLIKIRRELHLCCRLIV